MSVSMTESKGTPTPILVIACGALAHEIQAIKKANDWPHLHLQCLDAELHNRPELIPGKLREKIERYRDQYARIFIGYGDCGTGGEIDRIISEEGIDRLPGAHCYSFFAGEQVFDDLAEQELGTFYLTDYLARHFDRLIIKGMGLEKYPDMRDMLFGNYRRVMYLSQLSDPKILEAARSAAEYLQLRFEHRHCGYGDLETSLGAQVIASDSRACSA